MAEVFGKEYRHPEQVGWKGFVETKDKIAFIGLDGSWVVYNQREPSGAVIGKPIIIQ